MPPSRELFDLERRERMSVDSLVFAKILMKHRADIFHPSGEWLENVCAFVCANGVPLFFFTGAIREWTILSENVLFAKPVCVVALSFHFAFCLDRTKSIRSFG